MTSSKGNILFLILIGLFLFGLLSFAVSQSTEGDGDISKEDVQLTAGRIAQQASLMKSEYKRIKAFGDYEQVRFDTSSETDSGTCYNGSNTYSCRTIGLFNAVGGMPEPVFSADMKDPAFSASKQRWYLSNRRVVVNGTDLGTTEPDVTLWLLYPSPEICAAINQNILGDDTVSLNTTATSAAGYTLEAYDEDGAYAIYTGADGMELPTLGCSKSASDTYIYVTVIQSN